MPCAGEAQVLNDFLSPVSRVRTSRSENVGTKPTTPTTTDVRSTDLLPSRWPPLLRADDLRASAQDRVHGGGIRKQLRKIRREHDHVAPPRVPRRILAAHAALEIVFTQHLNSLFPTGLLHMRAFPVSSLCVH